MKSILLLLIVFVTAGATAQTSQTMYAAVREGLPVYKEPTVHSKILGKISYGKKILLSDHIEYPKDKYGAVVTQFLDDSTKQLVNSEGLWGSWGIAKFNNKLGYVFDSYLLPVAPPKKGVTTIATYFNQVSPLAGKTKVKKTLEYGEYEEMTKVLYKNGMEEKKWYESSNYTSEEYTLPKFTVQQAFLLMGLLNNEHSLFIAEKDSLPIEQLIIKDTERFSDKQIYIERSDDLEVEKIIIDHQRYGILKIYSSDGYKPEVIISFNEWLSSI